VDQRLELPVDPVVAELVAAAALDDLVRFLLDDEEVRRQRQENLLRPRNPALKDLEPLLEAVGVLGVLHDLLNARPRQLPVDQFLDLADVVLRHHGLLGSPSGDEAASSPEYS